MSAFAPIHNHTQYSALDGLSTPLEIVQRCQCIGCTSAGITDHGTVAGHLEFAKVCRANDIKPIFGVEFYHGVKTEFGKAERDQFHFVAGAMTDEGLRNIWRMVDAASNPKNYRFVGRINFDIAAQFSEGVFATSACIQGLVAQAVLAEVDGTVPAHLHRVLDRYLEIYRDNFYIEIHTYPGEEHELLNRVLVELARERGVPLIYATDAHFACNPGEAPIWMADLSFRPLRAINEGDEIIGWSKESGHKSRLCKSTVKRVHVYHNAELVQVTFESGRKLRCTPNHLWRTMSYGGPADSEYFVEAEIGRNLVHVVEPTPALPPELASKAAWLAGIFDGEGEGTHNKVGMSQSDKNPAVVERIREYLRDLGFDTWHEQEKRPGHDMNRFFVAGGREEFVRFANWTKPAQTHKIVASVLNAMWKSPDRVVAVEPVAGKHTVYGLTTTTDNYIAWGYASKNSPEQYEIHDAYVAMQTGESVLLPPEKRKMWHPKSLYIQSEAEIRASFSYLPTDVVDEALHNSAMLAEKCNADLPAVSRHIPQFVVGDCPWHEGKAMTPAAFFFGLVEKGIAWRYGDDPGDVVWNQAAYEVEVMLDAGLEHYFLQVWDFCEYCDREGITRGPGRGSAAGSIVAYALGITDIDPLRYDLIFERFWNPGRAKGFPDIDIDFPVTQRKKVRTYLMKRWGHDKVRTIGTTMRMKPKAVLDKTQKACAITWEEKEELKKIISGVPDIDIHGADTIGWSSDIDPGKTIYVMHSTPEVKHNVGHRIIEWLEAQPEHRQDALLRWLSIVEVVCGRVSGYGVHPSGVIVADIPLADYAPCMYNRSQEVQVTCFPMSEVDALGLMKDDLLGLRNLDTLERWEELVGEKMDWHALTYEEHPEAMWELLDHGLTLGIFQIEKGYARHLCKEMKPRSIDDLGVIVAINRPGPIRAGVPESYIKRKNGQEVVTYDHPLLETILNDTYGHIVYQEQVMRFFAAIGYDDGDTDEIRKILGKKKPEIMKTVRYGDGEWVGKGYNDMALAAGIDQITADLLWSKIEGFASYSFNKSHAIAYATMAFRTLYAKWRDKEAFTIACIQTNPEDAGDYVSEGRRMEIEILPPDIRRSEWDIAKMGDGEVVFGFSNVKGIGKGSSQYIVELRDAYTNVLTGMELADVLDREQEVWAMARTTPKSPQQRLRTNQILALEQAGAFDNYINRDIGLEERQKYEKELLQVILTDNCEEVLAYHSDEIEQCDTYYELETEGPGVRLDIPGVVATVTPKRTKREGKAMGIVTIEYQGDEAEFVVFPREWTNYRFLWKERTPGIFGLVKTERGVHFDKGQRLS